LEEFILQQQTVVFNGIWVPSILLHLSMLLLLWS